MAHRPISLQEKHRRVVAKFQSLEPYKDSQQTIVLLDEFHAKEIDIKRVLKDEGGKDEGGRGFGVTDFWIPIPYDFLKRVLEPRFLRSWTSAQNGLLSTTFDFDRGILDPESKSVPAHYSLSMGACTERGHPKTLNIGKTLGNTRSAIVNKVEIEGKESSPLALKVIRRKFEFEEETRQMKRILGEIRAMRKLRHPHYIRLIASYTTEKVVGILMSPVADCNLHEYLGQIWDTSDAQTRRGMQDQLARFFGCLSQAVANLHCSHGIRHRDIKPKNILVQGSKVLLADFGIALDWFDSGETTTNTKDVMKDPAYCAPEVFFGKKKGTKSDIWSLGCVFLEMALVLEGLRADAVKQTIESRRYWDGIEAIQISSDKLRERHSRWEHEPLDWVQNMVKEERDSRWKAADVVGAILTSKLGCFSEICCQTWDEPTSLDDGLEEYRDNEKDNEPPPGRGDAEDESPSEQFAWIYHESSSMPIKARLLEGAQFFTNWISSDIVEQYQMETQSCQNSETIEMGGVTYHSKGQVQLSWKKFGENVMENDFFISALPVPFEMIVGTNS